MSTPGPSTPNAGVGATTGSADATLDRMVLRYLQTRGLTNFHKSLDSAMGENSGPNVVDEAELGRRLAIFSQTPSRPGDAKETLANLQDLGALGNNVTSQAAIQSLIVSVGSARAEEIISLDPRDRHEGFHDLEAWVDGSLDMYRVCRRVNKLWL
jgi:transcription initiation factor TFIID subunit 5